MAAVAGFVREFVKSPTTTAAVGPSSRRLARRMVDAVPVSGDPVVVELGPGTGAFTREIQHRLNGRGRHLTVELNERWARELGERFPKVESVCADAHGLPGVLAERAVQADAVVSGLPWAAHVERDGRSLVGVIAESLAPDGVFTQFAYTWTRWAAPARRLRAQIGEAFAEVEVSPTVWRNVPPAVAYVARRPR